MKIISECATFVPQIALNLLMSNKCLKSLNHMLDPEITSFLFLNWPARVRKGER